jgi:hypothetical protein
MEPREHLHHLVDHLPDSALAEARRVLISFQHAAQPTDQPQPAPLRVADLGWTQEQAADTRARLASFAEDWEAPGMEGYDEL